MHADRILVATDLSGPDRQCYAPAAALAARLGASVIALHVDDTGAAEMTGISGMHEYLEMVSMVRGMRVEQLVADFRALGVAVDFVIEAGSRPERVIERYVRDHDIGCIVMARHSERGPLKKLLGSTTKRVLHLTDVPVVVVPVDDDADIDPADAEPSAFRRILVPTDLGDSSGCALRAAVDLADRLGAELHVTHAVDLPAFVPTQSGEGYASMPGETLSALRRHLDEQLREHIAEATHREVAESIVSGASVLAAILSEATRIDADLVCAPSTGKGRLERFFLGSTTEALVERSPVPVMVMPPKYLKAWESG